MAMSSSRASFSSIRPACFALPLSATLERSKMSLPQSCVAAVCRTAGADLWNGNGLWDLWVIQGTWVFNSHYGDVFDCADAGYAQVSAHHAYTWECRTAGSHFDLYLILT